MQFIKSHHLCVYFGDASDNLRISNAYSSEKILTLQKKINYQMDNQLQNLFFPKQEHTADVVNVDSNNTSASFETIGDAVITKEKNNGIGVVTADCLPIVLYDKQNHALGVIHAGWRGLSKKIITNTIQAMNKSFGTHAKNLTVYLGPSACVCCYEVQKDFLSHFPDMVFEKKIIEIRSEKMFFNQRQSAIEELLENSVNISSIHFSNNICTICQPGFCSARKEKENAGRQPTVGILL